MAWYVRYAYGLVHVNYKVQICTWIHVDIVQQIKIIQYKSKLSVHVYAQVLSEFPLDNFSRITTFEFALRPVSQLSPEDFASSAVGDHEEHQEGIVSNLHTSSV